jgi:hypothetical protein
MSARQGRIFGLATWNYHTLPAALGCRDWFMARALQ